MDLLVKYGSVAVFKINIQIPSLYPRRKPRHFTHPALMILLDDCPQAVLPFLSHDALLQGLQSCRGKTVVIYIDTISASSQQSEKMVQY